MAAYRMKVSAGGLSEDDEGGAWEGVRLACKDPLTWLYTVIHFGIILAISYKDFFPSVSHNQTDRVTGKSGMALLTQHRSWQPSGILIS